LKTHFRFKIKRNKLMRKAYRKRLVSPASKKEKININILRKSRIEDLKTMINNKDYVEQAIIKLANSLTSGLMK
jgi:hypothetical protein